MNVNEYMITRRANADMAIAIKPESESTEKIGSFHITRAGGLFINTYIAPARDAADVKKANAFAKTAGRADMNRQIIPAAIGAVTNTNNILC